MEKFETYGKYSLTCLACVSLFSILSCDEKKTQDQIAEEVVYKGETQNQAKEFTLPNGEKGIVIPKLVGKNRGHFTPGGRFAKVVEGLKEIPPYIRIQDLIGIDYLTKNDTMFLYNDPDKGVVVIEGITTIFSSRVQVKIKKNL